MVKESDFQLIAGAHCDHLSHIWIDSQQTLTFVGCTFHMNTGYLRKSGEDNNALKTVL